MLHTDLRKPECLVCPLKNQKCVEGNGPLDAEILVVAEAPGGQEVEQGIPLVGWTGLFVNATLGNYGFPRSKIRVENVFQGQTAYRSKDGKLAASVCGRTIWDVLRAMPNLRTVIAFGEAALCELSGFRESEEAAKEFKQNLKKYQSWLKKRSKAEVVWYDRWKKYQAKSALREAKLRKAQESKRKKTPNTPKGPTPLKTPVPPPILRDEPLVAPTQPTQCGHSGITLFRGSPLWVHGYEGKVRLFPVVHPAAAAPRRTPRLRPLILADIRKAIDFHTGKRQPCEPIIEEIRDPQQLHEFLQSLQGTMRAVDIEWSRKNNELVAIGLGTGNHVGVVLFLDKSGWRMNELDRQKCFARIQGEFDTTELAWGGHFTCGYDEYRLSTVGLHFRSRWDSLYSFHILHSDLGSAIDEEALDTKGVSKSQATGYDLGFVMSVMTNLPYHKYMLDTDASEMDSNDLVRYCGLDVAGCWLAQDEMYREGARTMPNGLFQRELDEEMELVRRAQKMSRRGIPINEPLRQERLAKWEAEKERYAQEARSHQGSEVFNIGSSQHLAKALIAMGVQVRKHPETGNPMLAGNELFKLQRKYPNNKLLEIRMGYQKVMTEIRAYSQLAPWDDGKLHPSFKIHGTVGPRWSTTPNVQNLTMEQREVIG